MNRRGFLGALVGVIAAGVVDPELLLWRPGVKTFFLPSAAARGIERPLGIALQDAIAGEYVNILLSPEWIARDSLRLFKNNLAAVRLFNQAAQQDLQFAVGQPWPEAALRDRALARRFSA